jgi:MFS family permease
MAPLRTRDVRLIVGAVGISALGDFLLWVPLTLHVEEMTDSGLAVAGVMIALFGPVVLLAPVAGLIVDRLEARAVLIVVSLAQAVIAAALAFALDSVTAIIVLTALVGAGFAIAQPAEFALVPVIAGKSSLTEVNGYVEAARYGGMTIGPVIGGLLTAAGGVDVAMLVNAGTFAVVAGAGLLLHARRRPADASAEAGEATGRGIRDGVTVLFRDRMLAIVIGAVFASLLFMSASISAEVFFLKEDLDVGNTVYGVLFSCWFIGMVVGALLLSRRASRLGLAAGTLIAVVVQGIGLGMPTAWLVVWFAGLMWFVGGIGHGVKNVLARTLIQERVPDRLHGRAFAAYNGLRNGAELFAIAAGGALVAVLGGRVTLALAGALSALAGLAGLLVYRRRGDPEPVADEPAEPDPRSEPIAMPTVGE